MDSAEQAIALPAERRLETPHAAGIAGLCFAVLFALERWRGSTLLTPRWVRGWRQGRVRGA